MPEQHEGNYDSRQVPAQGLSGFGVVWEHLHSGPEQLFHSVQTAVDQSENVLVSWKTSESLASFQQIMLCLLTESCM